MERATDLLKNIYNKINRQHGHLCMLSSKTSDFTTDIYPALQLEGERWAVGLLSLDTWNSIPNITDENNIFRYSVDSGEVWKTITLPTGSYQIDQINSDIKIPMALNGDSGIEITANEPVLGSVVNITPATYQVDFTADNSLAATLGFEPVILHQGYHKSPNIVNILTVNSILVNCNIIKNSYLNGTQFPVLYSFFPNVPPGHKIIERPTTVVYLPLNSEQIQNIRIWLTDQDGNPLDFRGETITIRLHFRQI